MRNDDDSQPPTIREALSTLTVDDLKPLAVLVGAAATRKGELIDLLAAALGDPKEVRILYEGLDDVEQKSLQEATHESDGMLDLFSFRAKYGRAPDFGGSRYNYTGSKNPTTLRLFLPDRQFLPRDLQSILHGFVPEPPRPTVQAHDDLPPREKWGQFCVGSDVSEDGDGKEVELRLRHTSNAALHDIKAILRLIDMGEVRVGEKTHRPSKDAMKAITVVLAQGDFYPEADQNPDSWEPASDLRIQAFAWPMLVQAARLAETAGTRLKLTAAGRKATTMPAHELIRQLWDKWQKTTLLDEFSRIDVIKGQQAKGRVLTAVAARRDGVVAALSECPAQKWIATDEFFRLVKIVAPDFNVTHDSWKLYIGEQRYGSLGYDHANSWEVLEGRFVLAFLFEYAATLGLLDVAYVSPEGTRSDYGGLWGADSLSCLSRYDGLVYFRINALGAWCLGLSKDYVPAIVPHEPRLRVLPNLDVVAADRTLVPADVLLLERFAERKAESLWQLGPSKILDAVEKGLTVGELQAFLEARNDGSLPQTVKVFLDDLANKVNQLEDLGSARLIRCVDANLAQLLVHDRRLRNLCQLAGDRQIVFRAADETAIRRVLKELGYVLPPSK